MQPLIFCNAGGDYIIPSDLLAWKMVDSLGRTPGSISITLSKTQGEGQDIILNGFDDRNLSLTLISAAEGRGFITRWADISKVDQTFDATALSTIVRYYGTQVLGAGGQLGDERSISWTRAHIRNSFDDVLTNTEYGQAMVDVWKGGKSNLVIWFNTNLLTKTNLGDIIAFVEELGLHIYWPAVYGVGADTLGVPSLVPVYHPEATVLATDVDPLLGLKITATDMSRPAAEWDNVPISQRVLTPDTDDKSDAVFSVFTNELGDGGTRIYLPGVEPVENPTHIKVLARKWAIRASRQYTAKCYCYPKLQAGGIWRMWSDAIFVQDFYITKVTHEQSGNSAPTSTIEGYLI